MKKPIIIFHLIQEVKNVTFLDAPKVCKGLQSLKVQKELLPDRFLEHLGALLFSRRTLERSFKYSPESFIMLW